MVLLYSSYNSFDYTWLLMILASILALWAQFKVKSTYKKYNKVTSRTGMTGAEAAVRILSSQGINDVRIQRVAGELTDHYNPTDKTLNLSDSTYASTSVAAVGVAAHECGHAIQHAQGYSFLQFRTKLFPFASFGSKFSFVFIIAGLFFGSTNALIDVGIILFSLTVLFQVVTLPVEFDASNRALVLLQNTGVLYNEEAKQTKKVLSAAALTYVASAAVAVIQLLRLLLLRGSRRD